MFLPYSHVPLFQFLFQPLFPILLSLFMPFFEWGSHDEGISHVLMDPFTHRTWVAPSVWAIVPPYQVSCQRGRTLPLQSRWPSSNLCLMIDPMFGWWILPRHYPFSSAHSLVNTYGKGVLFSDPPFNFRSSWTIIEPRSSRTRPILIWIRAHNSRHPTI